MKITEDRKLKTNGVITSSQLIKTIKKQHGERCIFLNLMEFDALESNIDYVNAIKFGKKSRSWGNAYFSKEGILVKVHISAKDESDKIVKNQIFYYRDWQKNLPN